MENNSTQEPEKWLSFKGDRPLWIIIVILAVASVLVVYSSTASMAYIKANGDTAHYVLNQIKFLVLGFICMYFVYRQDYQSYSRIATFMFVVAVLMMLWTFVSHETINSANRWITIPLIGIRFQPSEVMKVALVMTLASQLAQRQAVISKIPILPSFSIADWKKNRQKNIDILTKTTFPVLAPIFIGCGLIFSSNFSTAAITFFICIVMLFIGRVRMGEIFRLCFSVGILMSIVLIIMIGFGIGRATTWENRIKNFAGVKTEQNDANEHEHMQVEQGKIAIASGGIFGKGPGNSTQRANLPHSYSDFAYAFIVEEYGIFGALIILVLYLWVFFRSILIFQRCETAFPSLLVLGLGLMITVQAFTNMMVSVNLGPVTGQTLPLISLGGSSIVLTMIALGMILGVSRQTEVVVPKET